MRKGKTLTPEESKELASDVYTQLRTCCADKSHEEKIDLIFRALQKAVADERESCARVAEELYTMRTQDGFETILKEAKRIATAIRNRGEKG